MPARTTLTAELQKEVLELQDDLRLRVDKLSDINKKWRDEHNAALAAERTSATWAEWSKERITLAAVAWVLTTVFIRFCEDNRLVTPVWISGPRSPEALDAQERFLIETAKTNPDVTDREWLLEAVDYLKHLPATAGLVDDNNPMWLVTPSGDAVERLLRFWRERSDDGILLRDLSDEHLDTRFLGDVYEEISLDAQERYALRQTPVFIEDFILDRTLEPALKERSIEGFKMIDPTCGSGHFLLGGFARLLDRLHRHAPDMDQRERVQSALDAVHGVDLNPFAVAITRFRLTVAALVASDITQLEDAPAFKYHLAAGDSLRHGHAQGEIDYGLEYTSDTVASQHAYATENYTMLRQILSPDQYDVVVGNPPYITVKDPAAGAYYRRAYKPYCKGTYQLTVPFMVRFHELARAGDRAGWVGQITGDGFTNKQFGEPLVTKYLPTKDLRLVVDASGVYVPGHGTPTVILVGRNTNPRATTLRAVLGVRGEPKQPAVAAEGSVWRSIVDHIDESGYSGRWISVVDLDRATLKEHPWSLSGGGARELKKTIESASSGRLRSEAAGKAGFASFPGADDAVIAPAPALRRDGIDQKMIRPLIIGELVRDYATIPGAAAIVPYDKAGELIPLEPASRWERRQWPFRTKLGAVTGFGGETQIDAGNPWWGWYRWVASRYRTPLTITFAEVATHNHFVLDRGGKAFKQSAPVIKLPEDATVEKHLGLLGVLNSSTACFWLRQVCPKKGGSGIGRGIQPEAWMDRYNFNSTNVDKLPLPSAFPLARARRLDQFARELSERTPGALAATQAPTPALLESFRRSYDETRARLIAEQEELDWEVYRLYGLVDEDLTLNAASAAATGDLPGLTLGQRAFEIVLARKIDVGDEESAWFSRHGSKPITEIPAEWPEAYRRLVERRIELIETHPFIRLLEQPEHKRRWRVKGNSWEEQQDRALRGWILDRLEDDGFWFDRVGRPTTKSVSLLADEVSRDPEIPGVLALWAGRRDEPVAKSLERLLAPEPVPYLAAYRYKEDGLRTRAAWEATWDLQRAEDAHARGESTHGDRGPSPLPPPPEYKASDYKRKEYWPHRNSLDVPKERFILYPDAGRESDPTPVLGWAGWDHAQQGLALGNLLIEGENQGWADDRLLPLVAGLAELLPWIEQWHSEFDPSWGGSPAEFLSATLDNYLSTLGVTRADLRAWRPLAATKGTGKGTRKG